MTPEPIEAICEEMERIKSVTTDDQAYDLAQLGYMPETWAARLRAFWSPQRKAFHEAATLWNVIRDEMRAFQNPTDRVRAWTALSSRHLNAEREMRAIFRALCDKEKKP